MARVKTFVNGGSLLPGDLNSMEDDYEFSFSTYRNLVDTMSYRFDAPGSGTYVIQDKGTGTGVAASGATAGLAIFHFDPVWITANTRSNFLRSFVSVAVNATAPTVNFTTGLYPVSAEAGGAATLSLTLGAVVTGSTVAINTPGASSYSSGNSGDFAAPTAGPYVFATVVSGAAAANSSVVVTARLQYRNV